MSVFTKEELDQFRAGANNTSVSIGPKPEQKKKGRGGFITSLISEAGGTGGALGGAATGAAIGSAVPGIGTAIGGLVGAGLGGFLGGTGGRLVENQVRDDELRVGDALKEGAISGIAGAGPIKLTKAIGGAAKGALGSSTAKEGAEKALGTSWLGKFTGDRGTKAGQRLTEQSAGLKADPSVGGVARLEDQTQFLTKYQGTPRQKRVAMENDMKTLSKQVDDILTKTPVKVDGSLVGQRLKTATEDLTDERFIDVDLLNPSVAKIVSRYSEKFAKAQDAKGVNDIVKTLNKTATRAQNKLVDPKAGVLTAQEQAALALKRAGDDVLGEISEIAPLKQQMAQIFEVTPQIAKEAERGLSSPFLGGVKAKTPVQVADNVAGRVGARLQGVAPVGQPGVKGTAARVLTGRAIEQDVSGTQPFEGEEQSQALDQQALGDEMMLDAALGGAEEEASDSPFAPQNVEQNVQAILKQGGDMKDVAAYLSNVKVMQELTGSKQSKPPSSMAQKQMATAQSGLDSLNTLEGIIKEKGVPKGTVVAGRGFLGGLGQRALGTAEYDAAANNIADSIIRMRTGAAATQDEMRTFRSQLPLASDDPATRRQKLITVRSYLKELSSAPSDGSLEDLVVAR